MKRSSNVTCNEKEKQSLYKAINCLVCFFFITQFSSLITHHFKYLTHLAQLLNIFHTICGPHTCHSVQFFFFFFFPVPKLTEPSEKKKKPRTDRTSERKKKKKKRTEQPTRRRKKEKVKIDQKLRLGIVCGSPMFV